MTIISSAEDVINMVTEFEYWMPPPYRSFLIYAIVTSSFLVCLFRERASSEKKEPS